MQEDLSGVVEYTKHKHLLTSFYSHELHLSLGMFSVIFSLEELFYFTFVYLLNLNLIMDGGFAEFWHGFPVGHGTATANQNNQMCDKFVANNEQQTAFTPFGALFGRHFPYDSTICYDKQAMLFL